MVLVLKISKRERESMRTRGREEERERKEVSESFKKEENVRNAFLMRNERWGCREWVDLREAWLAL